MNFEPEGVERGGRTDLSEGPSRFEVGTEYKRKRDVHGPYGGQERGGIATPAEHPLIFFFTGEKGKQFGYTDRFHVDGTFWYFGEGQIGDMVMARGNRAIRDHAVLGKTIHLFETGRRGFATYMGEATYVGHHIEERPDRDGNLRDAIIFELDITYPEATSAGVMAVRDRISGRSLWKRPLDEVRELAAKGPSKDATATERRQIAHVRSEAVRVYVLRRANGVCEACGMAAPFKTSAGRPYLEPHHMLRLADGGPDHPRSVAAVCPNCHREIHYGQDGDRLNDELKKRIAKLERVRP